MNREDFSVEQDGTGCWMVIHKTKGCLAVRWYKWEAYEFIDYYLKEQ